MSEWFYLITFSPLIFALGMLVGFFIGVKPVIVRQTVEEPKRGDPDA